MLKTIFFLKNFFITLSIIKTANSSKCLNKNNGTNPSLITCITNDNSDNNNKVVNNTFYSTIIFSTLIDNNTNETTTLDTIIVDNAYTNSNIGEQIGIGDTKVLPSSRNLFNKAKELTKNNSNYISGDILSSDVFYTPNDNEMNTYTKLGCLGVEMEAFALNAVAKINGGNSLTILTVSNIIGSDEETTAEERQTSFTNMIKLALDVLAEI